MPLTDYINLNPAPEATGGYGQGATIDDLMRLNAAYDYQTAANTIGQQTPFEQYQSYLNQQNPNTVQLWSAGVETNPYVNTVLGPTNISATGQATTPLTNIFSGPVPNLGLAGMGLNAIYNLGSAGVNALENIGVNQVALGNLPAGNLTVGSAGDVTYPSINALSGMNVSTGAMQGSGGTGEMGTTGWWPGDAFPGLNLNTGTLASSTPSTTTGQTATGQAGMGNVTTLPSISVSAPTYGGTVSNIGTIGSGYLSGANMSGANLAGNELNVMSPVNVTATPLTTTTSTGNIFSNITAPTVPVGPFAPTVLPTMTVTAPPASSTPTTTPTVTPTTTSTSNVTTLPAVTVTAPPVTTTVPGVTTTPVTTTGGLTTGITTPTVTNPVSTTGTTQTTATTSTTVPTTVDTGSNLNLGSLVGTATNLGQTGQRDFAKELAASRAALQGEQGNLMGLYGGIYQNLLNQTAIPQAAQQSLAQMQADAAKLQRVQQGYLSAEDVRNSQQAAREAYGARGQVMGPGAIGAEILNREAIRQQRENEARNAYQASMGNVFNAAQLQTGNIFSPIGNLVGSTFNPLGAYPQDVYSTNVNAQLARDISAANNAAAIEAAKYGATAQKNATLTNIGGNLLTKLLFG